MNHYNMKKTKESFLNDLKERNILAFNNIEMIGEYNGVKNKILVKDKYGECFMSPDSLLVGCNPSIKSALNKNQYFINKAKEIHGDMYNYDNINYTGCYNKLKIICNTHGEFLQSPSKHLFKQGCPKCSDDLRIGWTYSKWELAGKNSKYFDSFKMYIIKCFDKDTNEEFYKIGKTFGTMKHRFNRNKKMMPYKYETIVTIEGEPRYISELENKYKYKYKDYKYIPSKEFGGKYECFNINMFQDA